MNGSISTPTTVETSPGPTVLMLGQGWSPDQLGGLDRYFRALAEALPEAKGVVLGPASDAPRRIIAESNHAAPLPARLFAFTRAARRAGMDVSIVDSHFALYSVIALALPPLRSLPLIVHFHGPWADESVAAGRSGRAKYAIRKLIERRVYQRATKIVTLTDAFKRVLVERYGVEPWRVAVIPPGVNDNCFTPRDVDAARERFQIPRDAFVACCVRRLVPRMGIGVLLHAWQTVAAQAPNAQLLIAGDGSLADELRRETTARGLGHSVRFLGRISDEDLVCLYSAASVNIVPSISFEGFGLTVLEAASCGTPSVVTDVGGLPEAVRGLGSDLIVPPGSAEALATRIIAGIAGELPSRETTRRWAQGHSWQEVAGKHRELARAALLNGPSGKARIVFLDHTSALSGGELALLRLAPMLTAEVDVHVILGQDGPLTAELVREGISVEVRPFPVRAQDFRKGRVGVGPSSALAAIDTLVYAARLGWHLRAIRPDVVHSNSLKSGVYGAIAARLAGVPLVWHLRDRLAPDYLPRPILPWLRRFIGLSSRAVVCDAEATRETLETSRIRSKVVVIPSAVSLPTVMPRERSRPFTVGIIGRLAPWKGQDVLLRAFAAAFPEGDAQARIIGAALFGGEEKAYADTLIELAQNLGIEDRVEFRGHRTDISSELGDLDVLVHASVTPEPFGQVIIEGMAAGVPVIAADAGGPAEIITSGLNGLLYPTADVDALASCLVRLAGDTDLRHRLRSAGLERSQDFAPDISAKAVLELYTSISN